MKERTKRIFAVGGSVLTALSIALSLLALVGIGAFAATDTGMPGVSDIIPGENGTSALPLPEGGNVDTNDALTPDDTTRTPAVTSETPAVTTRPATTTARPSTTTSPDGTDTGMVDGEEGGGILGAIIAVIVVVAIILVVIALIPRKKR